MADAKNCRIQDNGLQDNGHVLMSRFTISILLHFIQCFQFAAAFICYYHKFAPPSRCLGGALLHRCSNERLFVTHLHKTSLHPFDHIAPYKFSSIPALPSCFCMYLVFYYVRGTITMHHTNMNQHIKLISIQA